MKDVTLIGLTGGIASGKSSVAKYLTELGYLVIDADEVVHRLQKRGGKLYQVLIEHFGQEILGEDLELDRPKLGRLIFSKPDGLEKSAQLQNDIIRQELWELKEKAKKTHHVIVMDIPLLFEENYDNWFDCIMLVYVPEEVQCQRLMARNQLSYSDAMARIKSQLPLEEKKKLSQIIIDNQGEFSQTKIQVQDFLAKICYNNHGI